MKTIINNSNDYLVAGIYRSLYAGQVLLILVAIPVLFMIGLTKKTNDARLQDNKQTIEVVQSVHNAPTDFTVVKR